MRELNINESNAVAGGIPKSQPLPPIVVPGYSIYGWFQNMNLQTTGLPGGVIAEEPGSATLLPIGTLATQLIEYDFGLARTQNKQLAFPTPSQNGTSVDFAQMCQWEGGNLAVAYNDGSNNITVGCGFNISGMTSSELNQLSQIDPGFAQALAPYVGLSVYQAAANGLPDFAITQQQSDELAQVFFSNTINSAQSLFSNFNTLPSAVQTVIADMIWTAGPSIFSPSYTDSQDVTSQNWTGLAQDLLNGSAWLNDQSRRAEEGDFLIKMLGLNIPS